MNPLWWKQILGVIRLEIRKTFFAKRGLWIYLLALAPVGLFLLHTIFELQMQRMGRVRNQTLGQMTFVFAAVFQFFFLRLAVFFGCLGIFMNLFRGEMLDRSLHFYLLAPIRREVLLCGKYLAGLIAATVVFTASTALQLAALLWQFDATTVSHFLYQSNGMSQIFAYLGVTVLACIGYGSVFLAAGLLFRNPIIPAAGILIWEAANPVLPALLKKISVIYYLKSLCPVSIPIDPGMPSLIALLVSNAEPVAGWIAIAGLLALSVVILAASMRRVRRLEINYTTE
jgi:ABC-type transport system involved in multi-copper enzyme maturation permease subunit